jgi:hypothetical protein
MSFAAITLCVASQPVFIFDIVYFVMTQSGNFWLHPRISKVPGSIVGLEAAMLTVFILLSFLIPPR